MLERASTKPPKCASTRLRAIQLPTVAVAAPVAPPQGADAISQFKQVIRPANPARLPTNLHNTTRQIIRTLIDGRLAFFLGCYAHLGNIPLGDDFYRKLAKELGRRKLSADNRAAVATLYANQYGDEALWKQVEEMISKWRVKPSMVHRFLAALPGFLRSKGRADAAPLWIITTNYDTVMEQSLADAQEPFRLLYYVGGTASRDDGLFAERAPDGSVRVIEKPDHLRTHDRSLNVIVKLNGGLFYGGGIEESVVVAPAHFERLAARIPERLPKFVQIALRERSLLFLGHGLAEADVHAILRYSSPKDGTIKSWAVQPPPNPNQLAAWQERVQFQRGLGLQIVPADLESFLVDLHRRLVQMPPK